MLYHKIVVFIVVLALWCCTSKPKVQENALSDLFANSNVKQLLSEVEENALRLKRADSLFSIATEKAILAEVSVNDELINSAMQNNRMANKILDVALSNYLKDLYKLKQALNDLLASLNLKTIQLPVNSRKKRYPKQVETLNEAHLHLSLIRNQITVLSEYSNGSEDVNGIVEAITIPQKINIYFYKNKHLPSDDVVCAQTEVKQRIYTTYSNGSYSFYLGDFSCCTQVDSIIERYLIPIENVGVSMGAIRVYHNYPQSPKVERNYIYSIQIAAFESEVTPDELPAISLEGKKIIYRMIGGLHKYFVEDFNTYGEAERFQQKNKLKDSFILKKTITP